LLANAFAFFIRSEFPTSYVVVLYGVQRVKKRMIVRFADIDGTVDHQCAGFRLRNQCRSLEYECGISTENAVSIFILYGYSL
jgi:hypothetical protein